MRINRAAVEAVDAMASADGWRMDRRSGSSPDDGLVGVFWFLGQGCVSDRPISTEDIGSTEELGSGEEGRGQDAD